MQVAKRNADGRVQGFAECSAYYGEPGPVILEGNKRYQIRGKYSGSNYWMLVNSYRSKEKAEVHCEYLAAHRPYNEYEVFDMVEVL